MDRQKGLTRVELLVAVGVVVFILFSVLQIKRWMGTLRSHTSPRRVLCQVNLKKWGLVFKLYTDDHDGNFIGGEGGGNGEQWFELARPYYKDHKLWLCPTATKPHAEGGRNPFGAWKVGEVSGSYGLNGWVCNLAQGKTDLRGRGPLENYWGSPLNVRDRAWFTRG